MTNKILNKKNSGKDFDFKKAFAELEEISNWFEHDDVDLKEGIEKYKRGLELIKEAQKHLKETENKLKKIKN
jgi:exodeoxyribonuclease VII small subunit